MEVLAIALYIVLAAAVVFFSIKLSDYVDLLDKKTKISGAFLGGILLAAVTSLPELFTSLTATIGVGGDGNQLVVGNILGSNAFNLMLFLFVFGVHFTHLVKAKVGKGHLITILITSIMYIVTLVAAFVFDGHGLLWGWFNPMSLVIVAVYVLSIIFTPKSEEAEDKETGSKLTVKQIIARFVIFSLLLVGASIGVTYVVDWITNLFPIGKTVGGALFLAIATSLPEATATVNLCRKKNFNAAYGDLLGSGIFNFFIMALADVFSFRCTAGIFHITQGGFFLIISAVVSMIIIVLFTVLLLKKVVTGSIFWRIIFLLGAVIIVGAYITSIVFGVVDLGIAWLPM